MLEPIYELQVSETLDAIEKDPGRRRLLDAIYDVIDLVCDRPQSREARVEQIRGEVAGVTMWMVPVRPRTEDDDWVVIWYPDGDDAVFAYVGSALFP